MTPPVIVAMSGGVDSSVAAALLQRQGRHVVGVTLSLVSCADDGEVSWCCGAGAAEQARAAAGRLGIPHYVLDGVARFEERVLRPCWQVYAEGRTPSPCAICNAELKLYLLLARCAALGGRFVATGHYARKLGAPGLTELHRGRDPRKDQSYFLCQLSQQQLERTLFPLGELRKSEVRALAAELGLPNAQRPDSQDACLRGEGGSFSEGLRQRFGGQARPGRILHVDGRVLGEHRGIHHFTIGQRRGLGVALGKPAYVARIEPPDIVVTTEPRDLLCAELLSSSPNWLGPPPRLPLRCEAQVRYRHKAAPVLVRAASGGRVRVSFQEGQRAVTAGQAVAFYQGGRLLGGAWILSSLARNAGAQGEA